MDPTHRSTVSHTQRVAVFLAPVAATDDWIDATVVLAVLAVLLRLLASSSSRREQSSRTTLARQETHRFVLRPILHDTKDPVFGDAQTTDQESFRLDREPFCFKP